MCSIYQFYVWMNAAQFNIRYNEIENISLAIHSLFLAFSLNI
jgi:hypothetical protein